MTYTLQHQGSVPCKKNRWHRGRNGAMYFDEPAAKRGNIQALLDALQFQIQAQWKRPPVQRASLALSFYARDGRSDADGKATTLIDVLVKAGVLVNDSIARLPHFLVTTLPVAGEERTVVEVTELETRR